MITKPYSRACLLSGGPDSLFAMLDCRPDVNLFVDYGQPAAERERDAARFISRKFGIPLIESCVGLHLGQMGVGGAEVVPGRNAVLLAIGANIADDISIGCCANDQADYEDCRSAFLVGIGAALGVRVRAPGLLLDKREIAERLPPGIPTWSCYRGGEGPCGECASCVEVSHAA